MQVTCLICMKPTPITFKQDHHARPQAAGGKAEDEVPLCAGCHHNLHRVSDMLRSGKVSLAEDSAKIAYPNYQDRERLFHFANLVLEWMTAKDDGKLPALEEVMVQFSLPFKVKAALQMMANEIKGPSGRKMGMATYIRLIMAEHVYKKYPALRPKKTL